MMVLSITPEHLLAVAQGFPPSRDTLIDLGRQLKDPRVGLDAIATRLKRDPVITARLLRMANSPAYARTEPVASVEEAVSVIGSQEIYRLVGLILLDQISHEGLPFYGISNQALRENSLFCALLMEQFAKAADEDPRFCYTLGLLRSLGKIALDRLGEERGLPRIAEIKEDEGLADWERSLFGPTNTEAAATILGAWRFPDEMVRGIRDHYDPAGRQMPLTHMLNLAANMANKLGHGLPGEAGYWLDSEEVYRKSGLDAERVKPIVDRALFAFERLLQTGN